MRFSGFDGSIQTGNIATTGVFPQNTNFLAALNDASGSYANAPYVQGVSIAGYALLNCNGNVGGNTVPAASGPQIIEEYTASAAAVSGGVYSYISPSNGMLDTPLLPHHAYIYSDGSECLGTQGCWDTSGNMVTRGYGWACSPTTYEYN